MAPTKRKTDAKPPTTSTSTRVTRSSARQASQGTTTKVEVAETVPKAKKAKLTSKEKKVESKPKTKEEQVEEEEEEAPLSEGVNGSKAKKAKLSSKEKVESKKPKSTKEEEEEVLLTEGVNGSKTIVIEHCKQCNQFKIRAIKVKDGLETAVSGITVLINPEKPRRGCFEVREEGGKKFISLLDMKRPFAPMKALDMDVVISDIVEQIK